MTTEQAKEALKSKSIVIYNGYEWYIDHIITGYEKGFYINLFLVPTNRINSATVAEMKDCEVKIN